MMPTLLTHLDTLIVRGAAIVLALQPAAAPSGGGGGGTHSGAAPGGGQLMNFLMLPLLFGFVYFFMLRPMKKQQQEQESLQKSLRKGDQVVTSSGMIGTIVGVDEREITVEVAERVRVRFLRDSVTKRYDPKAKSDADARKS